MADFTLCFNPTRGLYIVNAICECKDTLATSHDITSQRVISFKVPDTDNLFEVEIHTYFRSCKYSYMYATIKYKDEYLLDFDAQKIKAYGAIQLNQFHVSAKDDYRWGLLFNRIIKVYQNKDHFYNHNIIEQYFSMLNQIMEKDSISTKTYPWNAEEKTLTWKKTFDIFSVFSNRLFDLLSSIEQYDWFYNEYRNQILTSCSTFMRILRSQYTHLSFQDTKDTREKRILATFDKIHNVLEKNTDSHIFFSMCLG